MSWLLNAILTLLTIVMIEITGELLHIVLRPLRRLYRPPHGAAVLALTWGVCVILFVLGCRADPNRFLLKTGLILGTTTVAGLASLTYRDERRQAQGLPPVTMPTHLGRKGRFFCGALALLSIGGAAAAGLVGGGEYWLSIAGSPGAGVKR